MKQFLRRVLSLMLTALTLFSILPLQPALADSWPSLSESAYCEFAASKSFNAYCDSSLTTRGTCSPARSYGAAVYRGDKCRIYQIVNTNVLKIAYPTSSGHRSAYVHLSDVFPSSSVQATTKARGKVTVYTVPGGSSYGYTESGDTVWKIGVTGNYTAIIYQAKSGNRAYKYGWVKTSQYNSLLRQSTGSTSSSSASSATSSTWDSRIGKTVASIKNGSSYTYCYNSSGNISARGGYYGQCTWYALGRFREVTGIDLKTAPHAKYWLAYNANDSRVRILKGANQIVAQSIAVRESGSYGHVMFIEHVTYQNGRPAYVYFTECNSDGNGRYDAGKDCILQRMTYSDFVNKKKPAGYIVKR